MAGRHNTVRVAHERCRVALPGGERTCVVVHPAYQPYCHHHLWRSREAILETVRRLTVRLEELEQEQQDA